MRDLVPRFAREIDQPSTDGLNTWLISRAAARDVKGVISGLGGDEWFAGYPATGVVQDFSSGPKKVYSLPAQVAATLRDLVPRSRLARRLDGLASKAHPVATWMDCHRVFGYLLARRLVNGGTAGNDHDGVQRVLSLIGPDWAGESPIGLTCLLDISVYMRCQLLRDSDATSMAHSLELRVPLVDAKVANFARSCADRFKRGGGGENGYEYGSTGAKRVLIHALRDILPRDIAQTPKRGFGLPIEYWARHDLSALIEETCSREAVATRGLIDPDELSRLTSTTRYWSPWPQRWALMILEIWCRAVIDRQPVLAGQR
jgi:asparagine synthase (glutamine-hydrolysing)